MRLIAAFGAALLLAGFMPASAQDVTAYSYDELGRVTTVTHPSGAKSGYGYDKANNRAVTQTALNGVLNMPPVPNSNQSPTCTNWSISLNIPYPPYGTNTATISPAVNDFIAHCSDGDGGTLSLVSPSSTSVTINRGQTVYVAYTVSDGQGGTGSAYLTVTFP